MALKGLKVGSGWKRLVWQRDKPGRADRLFCGWCARAGC